MSDLCLFRDFRSVYLDGLLHVCNNYIFHAIYRTSVCNLCYKTINHPRFLSLTFEKEKTVADARVSSCIFARLQSQIGTHKQ